jgi:Fur family transcriptional regulator, ferric uptake regulator
MASIDEQLKNQLKRANQSATAPRMKIFHTLRDNPPLTMSELVAKLSGEVNRASVYRTVELFETLGIAQRLHFGWKYKLELSDTFHEHHHHLVCTNCGTMVDIPEDDAVETYLEKLAANQGFTITKHQLEIQGLCNTCSRTIS